MDRTIGVGEYQVGSNAGYVVALCSTKETKRTIEQTTDLGQVSTQRLPIKEIRRVAAAGTAGGIEQN